MHVVVLLVILLGAALGLGLLVYAPARDVVLPIDAPYALVPQTGFYGVEYFPDGRPFRWAKDRMTLQVPNPAGQVRLRFVAVGGPAGPTPIRIRSGAEAFALTLRPERRVYTLLLRPQQGERLTLQIQSPTVTADSRRLGFMLASLAVGGGGELLGHFLAGLILATVGVVVYAQQRGLGVLATASVVLALQVAVALAQAAGGWRYGLATPLLIFGGMSCLTAALAERWFPRGQRSMRNLAILVGLLMAWIVGAGLEPGWRFGDIALPLAVASIGGYALLRRAGFGADTSLGVTLALQGGAVLWKNGGVWHYGALTDGLLLGGCAALAAAALDLLPRHEPASVPPRPALARTEWAFVALVLLAALAVRLPWLTAPDPVGDLELAARRMGALYEQGLAGAYTGGDYLPLRLYLLYGLSQFVLPLGGGFVAPLPPATLVLVKLPSLIADLATIAILYLWSCRWVSPLRSASVAALYALSPVVWINVAWWGQVDSLLVLPLLGSLLLLDRARGRWSWVCWALALLIKAQAIVLAPLLYVVTVRRHGCRGLVTGASSAAALLLAGCAPLVLAGQGEGLAEAYLSSVGRFPIVSVGAYNLWELFGAAAAHDGQPFIGGWSYRAIGLALVGGMALCVGIALALRYDRPMVLDGAAVLLLAFFVLPTQIHQRYLFLCLIFVAARIASDLPVLVFYLILAASATVNVLGDLSGFMPAIADTISLSPLPKILALVNLLVLVALTFRLLRRAIARLRCGSELPPVLFGQRYR